jgi:hypothetical protein
MSYAKRRRVSKYGGVAWVDLLLRSEEMLLHGCLLCNLLFGFLGEAEAWGSEWEDFVDESSWSIV